MRKKQSAKLLLFFFLYKLLLLLLSFIRTCVFLAVNPTPAFVFFSYKFFASFFLLYIWPQRIITMTERKVYFHKHNFGGIFESGPCVFWGNGDGYNPFSGDEELMERSLNHPSHCQHPFDFFWTGYVSDAPTNCYFCDDIPSNNIFRHCSFCNITVCRSCLKDPPPLNVFFSRHLRL